jgi:spoIIIJ-associated protein
MSEPREFNASTVEYALDKASSALGIERGSLSYEVLDEGSSGFLGLGARDARITATLEREDHESVSSPSSPSEAEPSETESSEVESDPDPHNKDVDGSQEQPGSDISSGETGAASDELLTEVRQRVENTLDAMAFDHRVEVRDEEEVVTVDVDSDDAGLLIGHKGETIDALQYLTNVALYRNGQSSKKVVVNCEGYRERRMKAVQGMAHRTAKRVAREGVSVDLPAMSSSERRAVHDYLKENPKVNSSSTGNDETRHVIVSPA